VSDACAARAASSRARAASSQAAASRRRAASHLVAQVIELTRQPIALAAGIRPRRLDALRRQRVAHLEEAEADVQALEVLDGVGIEHERRRTPASAPPACQRE
jgi:hypothetical protein